MAGNFTELDDIVLILDFMSSNERFAKLLYNKGSDPLNTSLPSGVSIGSLIKYKTLFPYMKVIDISEEGADVNVDVYYGKGNSRQGTQFFKTNYLFVDIYVHNDLWQIDTGIRTYNIMQEVDKMLNEVEIDGVNSFSFVSYEPIPSVNAKYSGYGIVYERVDLGRQGCDIDG